MVAVKIQAFGGMIPVMDERLLPENAASDSVNVWLYDGSLQGLVAPRDIFTLKNPNTRYAYRVPKGTGNRDFNNSYWLEFTTVDTSVVRTPVAGSSDPAYYWANGITPPGYTTTSRIVAGQTPLRLGIPQPGAAPTIGISGGVSIINETRAYVYTWVSEFGEEGPPSTPALATGKVDAVWTIGMTAPTVADRTNRLLSHTRIYRTVTSDQGVAGYFFVAEIPIATLSYVDAFSSDEVAANEELESTDWTGPPSALEGICTMANGVVAGWLDNEIWFCEPYRPHAWPVKYQIKTEYPIVAMMAVGQTMLIGTRGVPYLVSGTRPDTMTLQRIPTPEPCVSRGSMVAGPQGILYASHNGLIMASANGVVNVTRDIISKDKWADLFDLSNIRAAMLNEAYIVYCGVQDKVFQPDAFQEDAFQTTDGVNSHKGAIIEGKDPRVSFNRLTANDIVYNVTQDQWSGEALLLRHGKMQMLDLTYDFQQGYTWTSKLFELGHAQNLGACKITWELPEGVSYPSATMYIYADGRLRQTKRLPASDQVFRLKGGFLAQAYQFRIEGTLNIKSIQIASTVAELRA